MYVYGMVIYCTGHNRRELFWIFFVFSRVTQALNVSSSLFWILLGVFKLIITAVIYVRNVHKPVGLGCYVMTTHTDVVE